MKKHITEMSGYVNGGLLLDFKKAAYAQLELDLDGRAQDLVQVVVSEYAENGHVFYTPGWKTFKVDNFRITPEQKTYRFHIPTHLCAYGAFPHVDTPEEFGGEVAIFRYVEIAHYYGPVTVRRIEFFNDCTEEAQFESSFPELDKVWDLCKYTALATSIFPCYVDGERERMPYEGDAYITELSHFCSGNDYSIAERTIDHFMAHGNKTWPTEWLLATPLLVYYHTLYSGNKEPLARWLPDLPQKLLPHFCGEDGLLYPQEPVRDIIDWPESNRDGYELGKTNFVPNAYRYGALQLMAELTGDPAYSQTAASLRQTLRSQMMKNGLFVDSIGSSHTAMHTAMFALRFHLTEPSEVAAHQAILIKKRMGCSVYGAQYLLEGCFAGGLDDLGIKLMTDDGISSWNNMMRCGSTVTMEAWDESFKPHQDWSHPWGSAPANIIPRFVAGVRPLTPGFETFTVQPSSAAPERFFLRQPTPFGAIEVRHTQDSLEVKLADTERKLRQTAPGIYAVEH